MQTSYKYRPAIILLLSGTFRISHIAVLFYISLLSRMKISQLFILYINSIVFISIYLYLYLIGFIIEVKKGLLLQIMTLFLYLIAGKTKNMNLNMMNSLLDNTILLT